MFWTVSKAACQWLWGPQYRAERPLKPANGGNGIFLIIMIPMWIGMLWLAYQAFLS